MIVECINQNGEARGVEIDPLSRQYGWVFYKHAGGQWVTLRKATDEEVESAERHRRTEALLREWMVGKLAPSGTSQRRGNAP